MKLVNRNKYNNNLRLIIEMTISIIIILIILPMIILKEQFDFSNFDISNNSIVKGTEITFPMNGKVKLYRREKDEIDEIDLEEYVMGVVSSEVPANFENEALKAQAVAARTYYMNKRNNPCKDAKEKGGEICDSTNCQVYMDKEKRINSWSSSESEKNWHKIESAVNDTKGEVLTYDGVLLEYPQFFATSSGKTEDAKDVFSINVPYLKSEDSEGEEIAPKYKTTKKIPLNEFINKLGEKYSVSDLNENNFDSNVTILSHTEGGGVKEIKVCSNIISGTEFRKILELNSTNFSIDINKNQVIINCTGYGHGVGMSQWGANVMAKEGHTYEEILKHYYNGVQIDKIKYK